jgi:hypothetical protein
MIGRKITHMSVTYKQNQVVHVTRFGSTFRASIHTIAALDRAQARLNWLKRRGMVVPWARIVIIQPCYNTGVARSAHTHDFDCVLDVQVVGMGWARAQRFWRNLGFAAWWRTPAQGFTNHIHMALIPTGLRGHPTAAQVGQAYQHLGQRVGDYIDGGWTTTSPHRIDATSQIVDYFWHAEGLAGEHFTGYDKSWFPPNIAATVYTFNPRDLNPKGITA